MEAELAWSVVALSCSCSSPHPNYRDSRPGGRITSPSRCTSCWRTERERREPNSTSELKCGTPTDVSDTIHRSNESIWLIQFDWNHLKLPRLARGVGGTFEFIRSVHTVSITVAQPSWIQINNQLISSFTLSDRLILRLLFGMQRLSNLQMKSPSINQRHRSIIGFINSIRLETKSCRISCRKLTVKYDRAYDYE